MQTKSWKYKGWTVVADKSEVYPDDPGNGTPLMVHAFGNYHGTFNCAIMEGEVDGYQIPDDVYQWLESIEEEAEAFVYG